jgi:3-keto-5-aminohexanoate cleavage enzyme
MPYDGYSDYFEKPVILSVALTGGAQGKEANPNLPEQPEEIATDLAACEEAGASIAHIHARDEDGDPTTSVEKFQEIRDLIDDYCDDILVNITTGGFELGEHRLRPALDVEPQPDLATIDLGPLNFGYDTYALNTREQNELYAEKMLDQGVKPELEIFNNGHIPEMDHLIEEDLLAEPYWCSLVFGMQNGIPASPRNLVNTVDNLPNEAEWQCLAVGRHQLPLTTMAMTMGGHVRVGMEDNVFYDKGELVESNAQFVRRAARIADELNRPVATPDEAREILDL